MTSIKMVRQDLEEIVSGNFTPDALGPDVYDAVLARARAEPKRYLKTMVGTYLSGEFNAVALSFMRLPLVIELLADDDPAAARDTAKLLLRHFDGILVIYDQATDKEKLKALLPGSAITMHQRLDRQRQVLRRLIAAEEPGP